MLKLLDQVHDLDAHLLGEVRQLVLLQLFESVIPDEPDGQTLLRAARAGFGAERGDLDEQAFGRVARAAPDGVEVQHDLARLFDALHLT